METNNITRVREALFDTLDKLRDKNNPMPLDIAREIVNVSQAIINSAKVEVDFVRATNGAGTGFLGDSGTQKKITTTGVQTTHSVPGGTKISHRIA